MKKGKLKLPDITFLSIMEESVNKKRDHNIERETYSSLGITTRDNKHSQISLSQL